LWRPPWTVPELCFNFRGRHDKPGDDVRMIQNEW
jgi:hypothetical protein